MAHSSCIELTRADEARLLEIARASIESGLVTSQPLEPDLALISGALTELLGSFVTLTKNGTLRGCVGSIQPRHPLARCVSIAAFNAAFRDARFPPLADTETGATQIEISVLSPMEPLEAHSNAELLAELRPHEDGLLMEDAGYRATFLPKVWEKIPDPHRFVAELKAKAGLPGDYWSGSIRFYRYRTTSVAESPAQPTQVT